MEHPYWPIFDLRLRVGDLELRPMTEADQPLVADLLPDDVELDPAATTYGLADVHLTRAVIVHQSYWRGFGTWSPAHWRLNFLVSLAGEPIGAQELEGTDFPLLRTVDTASFLVPDARGRGLGAAMRCAVLGLAFEGLAAEAAITSAWHDNLASLGVSRSLGYQPNGEHLHARGDGRDRMVHLRLTREDWTARARPVTEIIGLEACRPLFGL